MLVAHLWAGVNDYLTGWPNSALTLALVVIAAVLLVVALRGTPAQKSLAIAYCVLP